MSHSKDASWKAANIQMPVTSMAIWPALNRSPSATPPISASLGMTSSSVTKPTIVSSASTHSGALIVTSVWSSLKKLQPFWAAFL